MLIGHFAVGFAAKKLIPKTSLATLFVACQFLDLVWPIAMFLGVELASHNHSVPTFNALDLKSIPYSHSLGMAIVWSFIFGLFVKLFRHSNREATIVGLLVFSHWILDFITHIPDLPLWFGQSKVGLGLWRSKWGTFVVEMGLYAVGIFLYWRTKRPFSKNKKIIFYALTTFLVVIYIVHVFGPKPPETDSPYLVSGPAFAIWLVVIWSYFADRPPTSPAT